ncbi:MAG: hypothetical protein M1816_001357 [Peltula sp. TS41687]|nr:MAG: hypothetical protein M1816_001357 [Peltula sp. TS41687]
MKPASKSSRIKKNQMFAQIQGLLKWAAEDLSRSKWDELMKTDALRDFLRMAYKRRPKVFKELTKEANLKPEQNSSPGKMKNKQQAGGSDRSGNNDDTAHAAQMMNGVNIQRRAKVKQNASSKDGSEQERAPTKEELDAQFGWDIVNEKDSAFEHMMGMMAHITGDMTASIDKFRAVFRFFSTLDTYQIKVDLRAYLKLREVQSGRENYTFAVDLSNPLALLKEIDFSSSEKTYFAVRRAWILTKFYYQVEQKISVIKRDLERVPGANKSHAWLACRELAQADIGEEGFSQLGPKAQEEMTKVVRKKYQWGDRMVQLSASFGGDGIFLVLAVAHASFYSVESFTELQIKVFHWLARRMHSVIKLAQEASPYIEGFVRKGFLTQEQQEVLVREEEVDYRGMFPLDEGAEDDEVAEDEGMDQSEDDLEDSTEEDIRGDIEDGLEEDIQGEIEVETEEQLPSEMHPSGDAEEESDSSGDEESSGSGSDKEH